MSATNSLESSSPTPCPNQIATLERRIAELEQDKAHLAKAVSESNQRVAEAKKSTAAAEAETAAAKQRAQTRYTERLHANNEARNLQDAMKEQAFKHNDYAIKASRLVSTLRARIAHLETEISTKEAKIQELKAELHEIHTGFLANQREEVNIETQPDKIVHDLKNKIISLELSLAKAEQDKEQAVKDKDVMANSQAKFETDQAYLKSREIALMQTNQIKLQNAQLDWHSKLEIVKKREIQMAKELKEAKWEAEDAKQKLQMATRTMQNTPQKLGVQQKHQQQQQLQTSNSDKKRRSSLNGNTETTTSAFQRARNQSLLLNSIGMGPNPLTGMCGGAPRTEAPPVSRQPMNMAQDVGYRQYPSLSFDSSASQSPPIPTAQQQYFPGHGPSPVQQYGISTQPRSLMGQQQPIGPMPPQQQPGLVQNARLNNTGSQAQTHSNHGINVHLAVNTGAVQQPHHGIAQQPPPSFMLSRTHQSNSTNASFFPNTQGNTIPSAFDTDIFATDSSNVTPGNIDFFLNNDLGFANYLTGEMFQDPLYSNDFTTSMDGNAQSQDSANAAPANTNATWSGGQGPAPHPGFAPR
ncbi:hypothetical protein COCSADRAFT_194440 [Bipolaris sorokiniana ND90Pr]|uniref:Uncharacterized protein n=1 Tax=Cochliobolus sativus (strain ND90Pr / ATCC 201652) TaxID=665912 RepID=M2QVB6_COCSN|nr:uncharacterized protein COCSADRAFT_194440 [Bipolaris sorokiniana ND90Pr]EMD59059.1 hypothetical protein COCSADRAFT_194440 [Bipolaris sorokiniana ND90Pr]